MRVPSACLPDNNLDNRTEWLLEKYLLDELPPHLHQKVKGDLAGSEELRAALADLKRSTRELQSFFPSGKFAYQLQEVRTSKTLNSMSELLYSFQFAVLRHKPLSIGVALLLICLILPLWYVNTDPDLPAQALGEGIRQKGNAHLRFHLKTNYGIREIQPGQTLTQGHHLQISFQVPERVYGIIFSIDGNHQINMHYPLNRTMADWIDGPIQQTLPSSYLLDNAPEFENFYFITSQSSFNSERILSEVKKNIAAIGYGDSLSNLPLTFSQHVFSFKKSIP